MVDQRYQCRACGEIMGGLDVYGACWHKRNGAECGPVDLRHSDKVHRSQVDAFGAPPVKTWDDYRRGCKMTFGGGHEGAKFAAFQHGIDTVFNLLEAEFPPAEVCKAAQSASGELAEAKREIEHWKKMYECAQNANALRSDVIDGLGL